MDDIYNNLTLEITSGAASGEKSPINDYNGTSKVATFTHSNRIENISVSILIKLLIIQKYLQ